MDGKEGANSNGLSGLFEDAGRGYLVDVDAGSRLFWQVLGKALKKMAIFNGIPEEMAGNHN